jgi:hypothetical protein
VRLPASSAAVVVDDRPRHVLLQLLVDFPNQGLALLLIDFERLAVEQLLQFEIAVAGIVPFGAASIVLVELLVGIVDPAARYIKPDLIVLAGDFRKPVGGFYRVELAVDINSFN